MLCLAALMLSQDHDEKFAIRTDSYKSALMPYLKNPGVFTSPLDPSGTLSYQLNPNLQNAALATIPDPSVTVLFYEGAYKKPLFRYGGKAVIGFVDGHVKLLTPAEVAALHWAL